MGYLSTGLGWEPGQADKTPSDMIDFVVAWAKMKEGIIKQFGVYRDAAGKPIIYKGYAQQPLMSYEQMRALQTFWGNLGKKLYSKLSAGDKEALEVIKANVKYSFAVADFVTESLRYHVDKRAADGSMVEVQTPNTYQHKYMPIPLTYEGMKTISNYVADLNTAVWTHFNRPTGYQMMMDALSETTGGFIFKAAIVTAKATHDAIDWTKDTIKDVAIHTGKVFDYMKWATYGGIALGGLWLVSKLRKRS